MNIERKTSHSFYRILCLGAIVCWLLAASTVTTLAQEKNAPEIVVENGTVMLPIVHGNEQAVTGLLPYLQQLPEFANMTMTLRILATGYRGAGWSSYGFCENIAYGYTTVAAVMNAWWASSGHQANILNSNMRHAGFGYYNSTDNWGPRWVQDYGYVNY